MTTNTAWADLVHGVAELEPTARGVRPHRLPAWARRQCPDPQLLGAEAQPSGVRVAFTTTATTVSLATHATRSTFTGVERPRGRFDAYVDGEPWASIEATGGDVTETDFATFVPTLIPGADDEVRLAGLPARDKLVEIWLPHNEQVELLALSSDAPLLAFRDRRPRWVHYGSSISQGSNAAGPSQSWVAVAARASGVDLRNLGLSGSAQVDQFAARTIRDLPADVISLELGINIANLDSMVARTFSSAVHGFLDTVRDGHSDTPIHVVSPFYCPIHEQTPGPGSLDAEALARGRLLFLATGRPGPGKITLELTRELLSEVVARRDDPNLHLIDGLDLYGPDDLAELPMVDQLHPDTEAHDRIGRRFAERVFPRR